MIINYTKPSFLFIRTLVLGIGLILFLSMNVKGQWVSTPVLNSGTNPTCPETQVQLLALSNSGNSPDYYETVYYWHFSTDGINWSIFPASNNYNSLNTSQPGIYRVEMIIIYRHVFWNCTSRSDWDNHCTNGFWDFVPSQTSYYSGDFELKNLPYKTIFNVTGGGGTCNGLSVGLDGSQPQYQYYLYANGIYKDILRGTGSALDFGIQPEGNYKILSVGTCQPIYMAGSASVVSQSQVKPVVTANGTKTFCNGGSVKLSTVSSSSAATYLWNTGATSSFIDVITSGSYSVTVTEAGGCSATSDLTNVTVNPLPSVSAGNNITTASGSSISFYATGATNFSWSGPGSFSATIFNPTISAATTANAGSYSVVGTDANGCFSTASTSVVVNTTPAGALNFDGNQSNVSINSSLANFGTGDFAIEMKVNTTSTNGSYLLSKRGICNGDNFISIGINNTGFVGAELDDNVNYSGFSGVTKINDGVWHHIALTRKSGVVTLYVDGNVDYTTTNNSNISSNYILTLGSSVCVGQNGSSNYQGSMDELRFWNRSICQSEIRNNINCELPNPISQIGLLAYYNFNQGNAYDVNPSVTTLSDISGKNNSGTLNNFALTGLTSNWVPGGVISGFSCGAYVAQVPTITGVNVYIQRSTTATVCSALGNYYGGSNALILTNADKITYTLTGKTIASGDGTGSDQLFNLGVTNVTITASNSCGSTSATFTVTVVDDVKPIALTKNITVYLDATGKATITPDQIDAGSHDNCSPVTLSINNTGKICATAAEGSTATLQAPTGASITVIDFASYGTPNGICGSFFKGFCDASSTLGIVTNGAVGQNSYSVGALNGVFGDPCGGTVKRLYIQATYKSATGATSSFDCSNIGANTVTLTVKDSSGNVSTADATVTVLDNIFPTVKVQPVTISLDATGAASITTALVNNGSFDNCTFALSLDKSTFNCSNVGANTVTLTAIDASGNKTSASTTVTVVDKVAPVVHTKDITILLDGNGKALITADMINNGSTDNCGIATYSLDKISFECSNVGIPSRVTLTVTDINGNASSATAVVTVLDKVAPVVHTKDITILLDANGNASITADMINNGSTDNCGIATYYLDKTTFDCSNLNYPSRVTLTVTDINGNASSATAVVTVLDKVAPIVHTKNITINLDANGNAAITANMINNNSTDNCGITSYSLDKSTFNCANVGANTVTLTATDASGNATSVSTTVTVIDNIAPTVKVKPTTVYLDASGTASMTTASVNYGSFDNCTFTLSLDKTTFNCANVGVNTVTLTAKDASGNSTSLNTTVTVVDNIAPTVKVKPVTIYLDASGATSITTASVDGGTFDNCSFTLSLDKTSFNCSNVGTNAVILTAKDASGNTTSATATVTVVDNIAPTVKVKPITITLVNGAASIIPASVDGGTFDNCTFTLSLDKSTFDCSNVSGNGDNIVNLTATDASGNKSTAPVHVTVIGELPSATIASVPTTSTYTGGNNNNLYLGYGAQSTTLQVTPVALKGNGSGFTYTYLWSGTGSSNLSSKTSQSPVFTPTVAGYYVFTVLVTNNYGCTTTATISICVTDVRVPGSNNKVYVCHAPPGNPANSHTLSISVNAVPAHLGNHPGDRLGSCDMTPCTAATALTTPQMYVEAESKRLDLPKELTVKASPNPTNNFFTLTITSNEVKTDATVRVMDAAGRPLNQFNKVVIGSSVTFGQSYTSGSYYAEVSQGTQHKVVKLIKLL